MKPHHAAAIALVGALFSACLPIPHREMSTHIMGRALDKDTRGPVSGAQVTMDGYFTASGTSGADGRFDLPSEMQWHFVMALGDPGCEVAVRASGYRAWRESFFCFDGYTWRQSKDVLLIPN